MTDAAADLTTEELADMLAAAQGVLGDRDATDAAYDAAYDTVMAIHDEDDRRAAVIHAAAVDIATSNFVTAIDQSADHDSEEDAIDCYWQNALDTAYETGIDSDAVNCAYSDLVSAHRAA